MSDTTFPNTDSQAANAQPIDLSFSTEISTATLVKLLIQKGIVSPAEIIEEERQMRFLKLHSDATESYTTKHHHSKLKKWAVKHRWSRRLTHRLFGWEFKRVRNHNHNHADSAEKDS
ncbi:MAG: hypothetical protein EHM72_11250 [Calditrichaeota bacterium]|nr:MAG: hypothetical protein EHM72_11250 [Calditrichota bacterium]